jgi:hypothetical protein
MSRLEALTMRSILVSTGPKRQWQAARKARDWSHHAQQMQLNSYDNPFALGAFQI